MNAQALHPRLLLAACAIDPADPANQALAGVMGDAFDRHGLDWLPLTGLPAASTRAVLVRRFPGADSGLGLDWATLSQAHRPEHRADEVGDLVALLMEYADVRAGLAEDSVAIAHALACASLGQNHLWQDLFLPSRRELSALIGHWFPALSVRNTGDMKWKKFFYKQLCERAEIFVCRSPSCAVCTDHAVCFGPEDGTARA